jgi:hypothetical protein
VNRQTKATVESVIAQCLACDWGSEARNAQANAARHHDRTGHTVRVSVETLITYGDPHAQPAAQARLPVD